jgi:hypothetical protein
MATNSAPPLFESADDAWHEVDQLVDEIARLAKSDISPDTFYIEVLQRVVSALGAEGGTIWTHGQGDEVHAQCQIHPGHPWLAGVPPLPGGDETQPSHAEVIAEVLKADRGRVIVPHREPIRGEATSNPTDFLLIVSPWTIDGASRGAIEIFQRSEASPQSQQGCLAFLDAIGDLVADFCRDRLVRDFRRRAKDGARLGQFARQVHASLDLKATAYTIANDGRSLLRCDRLTVLFRRPGPRYEVAAVSGVETVRRRTSVVQLLEQLSNCVAKVGESLLYPDSHGEPPPQVAEALSAYLDESHSRWLAVLPLGSREQGARSKERGEGGRGKDSNLPIGILVAEQFKGKLRQRGRSLLPAVCEHSSLALRNAAEVDAIPLAGLLRRAGRLLTAGRLVKIAILLTLVAAAVIALCCIPADFRIEAQGEIQPRQMADVFALSDGVVSALHAQHGEHVRAGQVLAELRRPQFDLEFKQVWGELQTARQRLASTEAEILLLHSDTDDQRRRHSQLIAQQEELQGSVHNLEEQQAILEKKRLELQVTSPMEGEVLTWNVQQLLQDRPVDRGQSLLTVGDLAGPWKLEVRIPDREIAHVLAAQRASGEPLEVTYRMVTRPGVDLRGTVDHIALRSETAASDESYVLATINIDRDAVPELVPGANVKAWIHCGRQPLGYVWFHDLLDTLRVWCYW